MRHRTSRRHGGLLRLAVFAALAAVLLRRLHGHDAHEHFAGAHDAHDGHGMATHYD